MAFGPVFVYFNGAGLRRRLRTGMESPRLGGGAGWIQNHLLCPSPGAIMIVDDATLDWLTALRAALVADATLAALVGTDPASGATKIFSRPPAHVALPYVSFGDTSQRAFSTSDSYGQEIVVDVHCWAMRQNDGN